MSCCCCCCCPDGVGDEEPGGVSADGAVVDAAAVGEGDDEDEDDTAKFNPPVELQDVAPAAEGRGPKAVCILMPTLLSSFFNHLAINLSVQWHFEVLLQNVTTSLSIMFLFPLGQAISTFSHTLRYVIGQSNSSSKL